MNEKLPMLVVRVAAVVLLPLGPHAAADTLIDPTRPVTATAEVNHAQDLLRVQAILDRAGQCIAIVGGRVVRAGDRLPWGEVQEVTPTGVRYVAGGRLQFMALEIPKLQVRRASASQADAP
jgi:hypothetical protein